MGRLSWLASLLHPSTLLHFKVFSFLLSLRSYRPFLESWIDLESSRMATQSEGGGLSPISQISQALKHLEDAQTSLSQARKLLENYRFNELLNSADTFPKTPTSDNPYSFPLLQHSIPDLCPLNRVLQLIVPHLLPRNSVNFPFLH